MFTHRNGILLGIYLCKTSICACYISSVIFSMQMWVVSRSISPREYNSLDFDFALKIAWVGSPLVGTFESISLYKLG